MPTLVLMRHGATLWGEQNRFAGWGDTPLSETGMKEARKAAQALVRSGLQFDLCYTSCLARARQSLDIMLDEMKASELPVRREWRLNERHYGALQGETRAAMTERYGNSQVVAWRRSFDVVPPPLDEGDPRWQEQLARLPMIPLADQPHTESMAQAAERVAPLWHESIAPDLKSGKQLLVVAHTSALRGLIRIIEGLNDADAAAFRIATAIPRVYVLDDDLKPLKTVDLTEGVASSLRHWFTALKPRRIGWI
ncbi:MAG: 2,3-bisphosphoglycerate-dependent phosphoglycerate mutase [Hyphomicrobiales bacterium]